MPIFNFTQKAIKFHLKQIYSKKSNKIEWYLGERKRIKLFSFTHKDLINTLHLLQQFSYTCCKEELVRDNWIRIIKKEIKRRKIKDELNKIKQSF